MQSKKDVIKRMHSNLKGVVMAKMLDSINSTKKDYDGQDAIWVSIQRG